MIEDGVESDNKQKDNLESEDQIKTEKVQNSQKKNDTAIDFKNANFYWRSAYKHLEDDDEGSDEDGGDEKDSDDQSEKKVDKLKKINSKISKGGRDLEEP